MPGTVLKSARATSGLLTLVRHVMLLTIFTDKEITLQRLNNLSNVTYFLVELGLELASKIVFLTTALSSFLIANTWEPGYSRVTSVLELNLLFQEEPEISSFIHCSIL